MSNYRVTNKHYLIKEGVVLTPDKDGHLRDDSYTISIYKKNVELQVNDGMLEECQEPIWTDEDMIDFYNFVDRTHETLQESIEQFKKEKGK